MSTRESGNWGEQLVADDLRAHGYTLRASQWRCRFGEIDIIAERDGVLVFVEVKLRSNLQYGQPREFVTAGKQKRLRAAALLYLTTYDLDVPARFDVAEVFTDAHRSPAHTRIEYIEDAF